MRWVTRYEDCTMPVRFRENRKMTVIRKCVNMINADGKNGKMMIIRVRYKYVTASQWEFNKRMEDV